MPSTRDRLATLVKGQSQDATLPELQQVVAAVTPELLETARSMIPSLYSERRKHLVTGVGIAAVLFAIASIFLVQTTKAVAVATYAFWAIGPPAWFFVEWAWIFESYGDTDRIAQFKTSTELAQKFWAGVLVMLGVASTSLRTSSPSE